MLSSNSPRATRFLIILTVALGSLTYGYGASIIATTLTQPTFVSYFDLVGSKAPSLVGAINGLFQTGGLFGALGSCWFADKYGRRTALATGSAFSIVGGGLQAGSVHIAMYLVSRLISGVGIGMLVTLVPLYQSECSPPKLRGLLVGMHGTLIAMGYTASSWVGVGFFFVGINGAQWRLPLALQCLPPLILSLTVFLLPESPRWLLGQDHVDAAFEAFQTSCADENVDYEAIREDFNLLHAQIKREREEQFSMLDMLRQPPIRKRCALGFYVMIMAQGTATLVITNYAAIIYSSLGFSPLKQLLLQSGYVSICLFGNWFNALVVDSMGRKNMLLIGICGVLTALIGESISVSRFQASGSTAAAWAAVFFLYWHIVCFSSTCDATSYIFAAEIFPTPLRARGLSISVSGLFLSTIIYLSVAPTAFHNIGWKFYLYFICFTFMSLIVVGVFFPETKGKSLEDIAEIFGATVEQQAPGDVKTGTSEHVEEAERISEGVTEK